MPYWKALTIRWLFSLVCSIPATGDKGRRTWPLTRDEIIADSATVVRTDCVQYEWNGPYRRTNTERIDRYCTNCEAMVQLCLDVRIVGNFHICLRIANLPRPLALCVRSVSMVSFSVEAMHNGMIVSMTMVRGYMYHVKSLQC